MSDPAQSEASLVILTLLPRKLAPSAFVFLLMLPLHHMSIAKSSPSCSKPKADNKALNPLSLQIPFYSALSLPREVLFKEKRIFSERLNIHGLFFKNQHLKSTQ